MSNLYRGLLDRVLSKSVSLIKIELTKHVMFCQESWPIPKGPIKTLCIPVLTFESFTHKSHVPEMLILSEYLKMYPHLPSQLSLTLLCRLFSAFPEECILPAPLTHFSSCALPRSIL